MFFYWTIFLILPLLLCLFFSIILYRDEAIECHKIILPQLRLTDKLAFLCTYYSGERRDYIESYLKINNDVSVIEDRSAGSNASTVVVMKKDGTMFYRKYAFNDDADKLQDQIDWIIGHQGDIPLPIITNRQEGRNYTAYDMHNYGSAIGLFQFIHKMPLDDSWKIIMNVLETLKYELHSKNIQSPSVDKMNEYIEKKVYRNINYIQENDRYIKSLERYDFINVNGKSVRTLKYYKELFEPENLQNVFLNDYYSDIHGDFTIENIICVLDEKEICEEEYVGKVKPKDFYFIDPNTDNIHNSPYLDYGKFLQSLHGSYEFLMMVSSVEVTENQVSYMIIKSDAYSYLYRRYIVYLQEHFRKNEIKSIYYHEIVHWIRLMPYKIRKNEKLAVVFYTGLLVVLNDVWEMEHGKENQACHI